MPNSTRIVPTARLLLAISALLAFSPNAPAAEDSFDYRILATSRTSTMEKELNEAAAAGYRFTRVMAGKSLSGGQVIIAMVKESAPQGQAARKYRLLATSRTSQMQTEMQQLAGAGYTYRDHTIFESAGGGREVAVVMELDPRQPAPGSDAYKLLATARTSTMQQELREAGAQGFFLLGLASGKTAAGNEIIAILRRPRYLGTAGRQKWASGG